MEEEEGGRNWWWVRLRRRVTWSACCGIWILSLFRSFSSLATILILDSQLRVGLTAGGYAGLVELGGSHCGTHNVERC